MTGNESVRRVGKWGVSRLGRLVPWLVPLFVLAAWQASVSFGWLSSRYLPAPFSVLTGRAAIGRQRRAVPLDRRELNAGICRTGRRRVDRFRAGPGERVVGCPPRGCSTARCRCCETFRTSR